MKKYIVSILFFIIFLNNMSCNSRIENGKTIQLNLTAILPLTGELSFLGDPGKNALELAKNEINADGNVVFNYTLVDSKAGAKEAVTEAIKAVEIEKSNILLTTLTAPSMAVRDSLRNKDILLCAIAIHPKLPEVGSPLVRFCYSGKQEADMLLKVISEGKEAIGLVVSNDASTDYQVKQIIVPELKKNGIDIKFVEWFHVGQKDFKNLIAIQTKYNVKRILLLGYGSDFSGILEALYTTGTMSNLTIYGGIGFVELGELKPEYNKAQYFITVPAFAVALSGEKGIRFKEKYKNIFNKEPSYDAAFTYDCVTILSKIVKERNTTYPKEIKEAILGKKFLGVTGELQFDEKGECASKIYLATFRKGILVSDER